MKAIFILLFSLLYAGVCGQATPYVDTLYHIQTQTVVYDTARDYAGHDQVLDMDISFPIDDNPAGCGRPMILLIHGGAFLAGSKSDPDIVHMREDFAKRGYVAVAINYRLGMFQTDQAYGCAVAGILGIPWACLNQSDTLEWYRALHRGVQDAHAAIRFLARDSYLGGLYQVDTRNVFVAGESAGAFIAMGVGYIDTPGERLAGTGARPNVLPPDTIYTPECFPSVVGLNLARPDLGPTEGNGQLPCNIPIRIRGVGDLFGGCFKNYFLTNANNGQIPSLYVFHQLADIIVSHNTYWLLGIYAYCLVYNGICPTYLLNPALSNGGTTIKSWIDALAANSQPHPDLLAEFVNNPMPCENQLPPAAPAHALDNYALRTGNMATFFASKIDQDTTQCAIGLRDAFTSISLHILPNPSQGRFRVESGPGVLIQTIEAYDLLGRKLEGITTGQVSAHSQQIQLPDGLAKGHYLLRIHTSAGVASRRILLN